MHPEIDRFAHIRSPLHRWDPRWKIASLAVFVLAVGAGAAVADGTPSWSSDLPPACAALCVSVMIVLVARIPLRSVLRQLRPAAAILGLLLVVFPLAYPAGGHTLYIGPVELSETGLLHATLIVLRVLAMLLLVYPMFGTSRFDLTMKALRSLRLSPKLVQVVLFTYRYLFVYADEVRRVQVAARSRAFKPRCNLRTMKFLGSSLGMLLVRSIERTERIRNAMRSRGFSGEFHALGQFHTKTYDIALAAVVVAAAGGLLAWRIA